MQNRPVHGAKAMRNRRPNSTDVHVGESIRAHRLIAGMSQSDLADKLGVSFQQVQKYEKGANRVGAGRLPQIAAIFDIPITALFEANAQAASGRKTATAAPVGLIPDRSALRLLASYTDIPDRRIRRCLVQLIDEIAGATRKRKSANGERAA
jgi:transcriptional regulator with XRE-family HTH domain